jgi:hypothetical protein
LLCRCHDPRPIPHRDYYRFAFFDNTEDCDQNDDFPVFFPDPRAAMIARVQWSPIPPGVNDEGLHDLVSPTETRPPHRGQSEWRNSHRPDGRLHAGGTLPVKVVYIDRPRRSRPDRAPDRYPPKSEDSWPLNADSVLEDHDALATPGAPTNRSCPGTDADDRRSFDPARVIDPVAVSAVTR